MGRGGAGAGEGRREVRGGGRGKDYSLPMSNRM